MMEEAGYVDAFRDNVGTGVLGDTICLTGDGGADVLDVTLGATTGADVRKDSADALIGFTGGLDIAVVGVVVG